MSSGTFVKLERYYNHYHLHGLDELRNYKAQAIKERDDVWGQILALAMATPKDITPSDENPESYIQERINDLRGLLTEAESHLQALCDIEDGWETREED